MIIDTNSRSKIKIGLLHFHRTSNMALNDGIQVMLSYNHKSKSTVKVVYEILSAENICVWFDERDMNDNMYDR